MSSRNAFGFPPVAWRAGCDRFASTLRRPLRRTRHYKDNAVVESFFSTLQLELDLDDSWETLIAPPPRDLAFWIEG